MSPTHPRHARSWVLRALFAGICAALVGAGFAVANYAGLPGTESYDWASMLPVIATYAVSSGMVGGLGAAAGMVFATGRRRRTVSLGRMMAGSTAGGMVGCFAPAVIGIAGFGSMSAPYAGTANISLSILITAATFVAIWGPSLASGPMGRIRGLVLASIAATMSAVCFALVGWGLLEGLGLIPTFKQIQCTARSVGLFNLAVVVGAGTSAVVGAYIGLATWIYLRLGDALRR